MLAAIQINNDAVNNFPQSKSQIFIGYSFDQQFITPLKWKW